MNADRRKFERLNFFEDPENIVDFSHNGTKCRNVSLLSFSAGGIFIAVAQSELGSFSKGDVLENIAFRFDGIELPSISGQVVYVLGMDSGDSVAKMG